VSNDAVRVDLVSSSSFQTGDPSEMADFLSSAYSRTWASSDRDGYRFSHSRVAASAGYALDSVFNSGPTTLEAVDAGDALVIVTVESGTLHRWSPSDDEWLRPGDVFLSALPAPGDLHGITDWRGHTRAQMLSTDLISSTTAEDPEEARPVRFCGVRPVSPSAAAQWQRLTRHAEQTLLNPDAARSPLVVTGLGRLLAATALLVFPTEPEPDPNGQSRDATAGTLRRAITHIEAHPDADLTIADIARAAHVTPRAVQLAFQRHLGTTPLAYLRRVRLDQAHRELLAARPGDGTTVSAVAYRWGFSSPSRFAAQYRQAYGRYPSRTLHT
jgi:AraC-like DNA-binding protein